MYFTQPKLFNMKDTNFTKNKTMKQIFLENGRDGLVKYLLEHKNNPVFTDTSFRDAH